MEAGSPPCAWIDLYPDGVPESLTLDHEDMLSMFRACVARRPSEPAMYYFDCSWTYGTIDAHSDALAAWLQEKGVGPGDRISIVMQNTAMFAICTLAAWKVRAVPVPGNPMYRAGELARILGDACPAVVICQDTQYKEVTAAIAEAGLAVIAVLVSSPSDGQNSNDARVLPPAVEISGAERLPELIRRYEGRRPGHIELTPDSLGLLLYTSGTTGLPKGAMLAHRSLAFNAQFMREWCALGSNSRILAIAPFFHITGFVCHLCASYSAQCSLILNYRFEPGVVLDMIRTWKPTFTIGAITAFHALMRLPTISAKDMESFQYVYSGGAPIPLALKRQLDAALGIAIHPCYGMTETAAPAVFTPFGAEAPLRDGALSIGIPIPSTQIRIVDESGNHLGPGQVGEILIRGPQVMSGYWRKADETAATLVDGWLHSGDVGVMDEQGWVYLIDRKKDVIIASGFKVWPREVEDVLYAHPLVREAAVVGLPDSYRGETVKAFVSLRAGAVVDAAALVAHCREWLAAYKVPRTVEILDDLPKTITGKIQRVALRTRS